ncbi:MAG: hypothetical protein IJW20_04105 [Clostridia bacterium]|nr:hypothetical protein [Clostridia bacterium]
MKNNGIEDIIIGNGYNTKKKKNTGLKIVMFFLIIILALFIGAYYYFTNMNTISAKEMFVTNISKSNIKELLQSNIYTTTVEKIQEKDFETNTNISFSTTLKNEELKNIDVSKVTLEISNKNDVDNLQSLNEAVLNYAENEVFRLKMLSNENSIALFSNEINDKYVGCNYENLESTLGITYDYELIQNLKTAENINITEDERNEYIKKYFSKIIENIPEEKFSIQENIAIQKDVDTIDVTAYTVQLNQEEVNSLIKTILTELKENTELLNKIAIVKESEVSEEVLEEIPEETPEVAPEITPEESTEIIPEETQDENSSEVSSENPVENVENNPEDVVESNPEENANPENQEEGNTDESSDIPVITINPVASISLENVTESQKEIKSELSSTKTPVYDATNLIKNLFFGKQVNMTVEELQELIDQKIQLNDYYETTDGTEGNGLIVNVYASKEKTEKITATFPDNSTLDIEFVKNSDKDNGIKITYLNEDENNKEKNGFSLDFNKIQNDANTTIKSTYNVIENEKINKKVIIDLNTDGTTSSKELKNDVVLTVSTSEGETKVVIDNTIEFKNVEGLEELTGENCLYLDQLPEEELKITLEDLKIKTQNLYNSKKENLNFINTNTGVTLEDVSSTVSREDAKNALITRVSNMMQEAIDNSQEFTIKNLENLTIDGYEVSSTVTEENAKIVVDTYTFNIDANFTLTDAE